MKLSEFQELIRSYKDLHSNLLNVEAQCRNSKTQEGLIVRIADRICADRILELLSTLQPYLVKEIKND
jgi:hypothetical protein